jgi:Spy/CpxP family protein refolding chaperone
MRKPMFLAAGIASCAIAVAVYANGPHLGGMHGGPMCGGGGGGGRLLGLMLHHANLSPDQSTQVHQIMESGRAQNAALAAQLKTATENLTNKLLTPGPLTAQDVDAQFQQITQLRTQMAQQRLATTLAARAVLSSDQVTSVAQLKNQMQQLHAQMRSLMQPN